MDKLIELREVTAGYGNKIALRNVTLDVWKMISWESSDRTAAGKRRF